MGIGNRFRYSVLKRKEMSGMNDYCAVNAKIKSMYSGALKHNDYEAIVSRNSVADICGYLKNDTSYADVLSDMSADKMHRGDIEQLLNHKMFMQYIRLYNFMNKAQRDVLRFWFMRLEIEFLKHRLRYIFNNESGGYQGSGDENSPFFTEHTKIDCDLVKRADTLADFVEACRNTPYYDVLKTAESIKSDYFSIVMMFDRTYYTMLWKEKEALPKAEAKSFADFVGPTVDMLNIMWIYRGKKYFRFDKEIIYTYLIPVRYRLSEEDIRMMVSGTDESSVLNLINGSRYSNLFNGVGEGSFTEENYHELDIKFSKRTFVTQPMSMAAVFAYLRLKQEEIYKITTIIEGVRYGLTPEIIKQHLSM